MNDNIDIIIPAYKAQETIIQTLSSILMQTIRNDLHIYIVDDHTPDHADEYDKVAERFIGLGLNVKVIHLESNQGPGVARQKGIEAGNSPFFTCIDADDTFANAVSLEILREGMKQDNPQFPADSIKCVSATFMQLGETLQEMVPHQNDMVWMFGKLYRRKFIEDYGIKFNTTRANEDTGYNKWVQLLCSNQNEQVRYLSDVVYLWHYKANSITRINNGQYALDQCFCGWTDNMIYAIENVKKKRPFDGTVLQMICSVMFQLYYYWVETVAKAPVFADQNWEYVKKFYHKCYKRIEEDLTDEAISQMFSMASMSKYQDGSMLGIIPCVGIKEFFDRLHAESYDPGHIYDVWKDMQNNSDTKQLMINNTACGVCPEGYAQYTGENNYKKEIKEK